MEPCRVRLPSFEGPLDLLLHLVKKEKLDIRDLPIALVAEQYLEYLERMRALDLNIAAEYLLMAATLLYLKSRALLPRPPQEEEEDLKEDLALKLLRYQAFKEAAEELSCRPLLDRDIFIRPSRDEEPEERLEADLGALIEALRKVMERIASTAEGEAVSPSGFDLRFKMAEVLEKLEGALSLPLGDLDGGELVVAFVAVLELARLGLVILWQESPFGDIWVALKGRGEEVQQLWA